MKENKKYSTTYYDDIYFALIETYVEITGYVPQPYFRVNQMWLKILNNNLPDDKEKKKALSILYLKCTAKNAEYMINGIDDIRKLREYKVLCE
ncbi:MAG: hypothetical protein K2G45_12670 [Lachnospiraceae bacterium]|nr:hypothetical protein [Lachnospiraceae bacterium]